MRISDWSSDVCSSDLRGLAARPQGRGDDADLHPCPGSRRRCGAQSAGQIVTAGVSTREAPVPGFVNDAVRVVARVATGEAVLAGRAPEPVQPRRPCECPFRWRLDRRAALRTMTKTAVP